MKKTYIVAAVMFSMLVSCTPDPSQRVIENYSFNFYSNSPERLEAGEVNDVALTFNDYSSELAGTDSVRVVFETKTGGGNITQESDYVPAGESLEAEWVMGTESTKQLLRASLFDLQGNYLTYVDNTAYGFRDNEWNAIDLTPDGRMRDIVTDPDYDLSLMVSDGLYRQADKYFLWEKVNDPLFESEGNPRTVEIDKNGVIYISTWKGEILKSTDHAESWTMCTKPYPDRPYFIYNYVANDNSVWAFVHEYPIKRSLDGGETWEEIGGDLSDHGFGDVFRLDNGNLLYHGSDCCSLYMSDDDGTTWTPVPTPGYSIKLFVGDNDEIIIVTQVSGIGIYISTDYGENFTSVHAVSPQFGTSMNNTFTWYDDFYYVLIPGFGIMKTYDLVNYENYWRNDDLLDLFIDHNGVLIAKDWDYKTVYYRNNTE